MVQKHAIEARNLLNLKNAEFKEIENEKIKSIEKTENRYKASVHALKCKCDVQCRALSGDPNTNKQYSKEIIQNIELLEISYNTTKEEQEKMKTSQTLREDTLTKTMKIINQNNSEKPEEYLKKTAKIKVQEKEQQQTQKSNVRYLSKSFFTTQNADNIF